MKRKGEGKEESKLQREINLTMCDKLISPFKKDVLFLSAAKR